MKQTLLALTILYISVFSFACENFYTTPVETLKATKIKTKSEKSICSDKKKNVEKDSKKECFRLDFRYIELFNVKQTSKIRHINIFLDKREFSKNILTKLLKHLSERNPEPETLIVRVKTDWEQLTFTSDCPGTGRSNMPPDPKEYDYHKAVLFRRNDVLYFEYNPVLKKPKMERVIVGKANDSSE